MSALMALSKRNMNVILLYIHIYTLSAGINITTHAQLMRISNNYNTNIIRQRYLSSKMTLLCLFYCFLFQVFL